jgi:hypothetical protein
MVFQSEKNRLEVQNIVPGPEANQVGNSLSLEGITLVNSGLYSFLVSWFCVCGKIIAYNIYKKHERLIFSSS